MPLFPQVPSTPDDDETPWQPPRTRNADPYTIFEKSLTEGYSIDTVLYLYSRKTPAGKVYDPRPIYASSEALISTSSYFAALLSGTFKEGQFGNIDGGFPEDQPKVISDYDYDSDSDFDLGEETDVEEFDPDILIHPAFRVDTNSKARIQSSTNANASLPETPPSSIDVDVSEDLLPPLLPDSSKPPRHGWVRNGHIVVIRMFAYATCLSLIRYLITGRIEYRPLRMSGSTEPNPPFGCSPKSMYRLCHMLDLNDLKPSVLSNLKYQLNLSIIFPELFSSAANMYPEIAEILARYFMQVRKNRSVVQATPEWIQKVVDGEYPGRGTVFNNVFLKLMSLK